MKLNVDLDNLYQTWEEQINNRDVGIGNVLLSLTKRSIFRMKIKKHRHDLEKSESTTTDEIVKQELRMLIEEVDKFFIQLNERHQNFVDFVNDIINESEGLSHERIQQFEQFTADESFVGDQCAICMGDIEIGRNMIRLDCDGQHTFCQVCIEGWFAEHNTCPICRHKF